MDRLQADAVRAISNGYAIVANVVGAAPIADGRWLDWPAGHYITIVGYEDEGRMLKIADERDPDREHQQGAHQAEDLVEHLGPPGDRGGLVSHLRRRHVGQRARDRLLGIGGALRARATGRRRYCIRRRLRCRARSAAPAVAATMHRYLDQLSCLLRPRSVGNADQALRSLAAFLADHAPEVTSVVDIDRRHIEDFIRWLAARPGRNAARVTPATLAHRLGTLRMFFVRVQEWDWPDALARVPIIAGDLPRQDHPLPKALDDAAAAQLLRAAQTHRRTLVRVVVEVLLRTGLRVGEFTALAADAVVLIGAGGSQPATSVWPTGRIWPAQSAATADRVGCAAHLHCKVHERLLVLARDAASPGWRRRPWADHGRLVRRSCPRTTGGVVRRAR